MSDSFKKFESGDNVVWITQPKKIDQFIKRKEIAFKIAKGKIEDNGGKIQPAIQTAEAFGRSLFEEYLKGETNDWTIQKWLEPLVKNIFNPMGTGATITNITDNQAESFVFNYYLNSEEKSDPYLTSIFNYGILKGVFLSAFPNGELLMKNSMAYGAPMDKFTFKTNKIENEDEINKKNLMKNNYARK